MSTSGPRSLTDWLRSRTDEELAELLRARPDLAIPAPGDVGTLANRAGIAFSVRRALEELDAFTLTVLSGLALAADRGPIPRGQLAAVVPGAPPAALAAALGRLHGLALTWGEDPVHVTGATREALAPYPAGLGRPAQALFGAASRGQLAPVLAALGLPELRHPDAGPALSEVFTDPARLGALLARCGEPERAVLGQLAAGPPVGTVKDALRPVEAANADSPVRWLLAHGLLVATDPNTVELPREVGLAIRGDAPLGPLRLQPDPLPTTKTDAASIDAAGAGQVLTALRQLEELLDGFAADPPTELRSGGLGVRDLRRAARALDTDELTAAGYLEMARAAELLDTGGPESAWLPTLRYDDWQALPVAQRWARLARGWLTMTRQPSLVGRRDERGKPFAPLSIEVERISAPGTRRRVLGVLADLPAGTAARSSEDVAARLAWLAPRRGGQQADVVAAVLAEAELIGVTGRGALTSYGRLLLAGEDPTARLASRLPEPVDHVLVQADLTVIAPGPLEPELAREMGAVADVESAGAATVYRVTEATVRRALDAGRAATELHELFRLRSRTPVPQALTYLIDDVARRHGALRVGTATAYLRCDDAALVAQVLADRQTDGLRLRRIAPTVLVSKAAVNRVLDVLREAGYAPVAESPEGAVLLTRPEARRAGGRGSTARAVVEPPVPSREQLVEVIRAMRAGDRSLREARRLNSAGPREGAAADLAEIPNLTTAATLGLLREAAREGRRVWLGYVNAQGAASQRIVEPSSISGGYLHGYDHQR
ncbi:MAG: hypothetical protein V7637_3836, partial [Mycobacteriales bacterium]